MSSIAEVELLPWTHSIKLQQHAELVEYFQQHIPEKSQILIELSPVKLRAIKELEKIIAGIQPNIRQFKHFPRIKKMLQDAKIASLEGHLNLSLLTDYNMYAAGLEILQEAEKKNCIIMPIDSDYSERERFRDSDEAAEKDELKIAERIEKFVRKNPERKSFAILGAYHVVRIQTNLRKTAVVARVKLTYLKRPKEMARIIQEEHLRRAKRLRAPFKHEWARRTITPDLFAKIKDHARKTNNSACVRRGK